MCHRRCVTRRATDIGHSVKSHAKQITRKVTHCLSRNHIRLIILFTHLTASLSHGGTFGSCRSSLEVDLRSKSSSRSLPLMVVSAGLIRSASSRTTLHSNSGVTSSNLSDDEISLAEVSSRDSVASRGTSRFLATCL